MKRVFKVGICTMTAVMLLSGCSGKDSTAATGAETQSSASESSAESTTPLETEAHVAESSVKLGNYKGIAVTMGKAEVSDSEMEMQLQQVLDANSEFVEVDRAAKDGDIVNINYKGLLDGKEFDGGSAEAYDLVLGSNNFIDGFEAGLIGVKKSDKKDLDLTFPENYSNADLSGKAVVFQVTVNSVQEEKIPVLNDEFVQGLATEDKTVDEFKNNLRESILEQKQYELERQRNIDLIEAIMAESDIVCATDIVDAEYEAQLKTYTEQATMYGMDLASMATMYGMDENGFKNEIRAIAVDISKQKLMYAEISQKENIAVTDEDRTQLAKANGYDTADALIAAFDKQQVEDAALSQKVLDFLIENAKITVAAATEAPTTAAVEETKAQ